MADPMSASALLDPDSLAETVRRAGEALRAREAAQTEELGLSSSDRARRKHNLSNASVPLEAHIVPHVIADDLVSTPALEAVRPHVRAREAGYSFAAFVGLLGERGRGKTVAMGWGVATLGGVYTKLDRAAHVMKRRIVADEQEWDRILTAPVLALDEVGAERDAVDGILALHDIVDERQSHGRITIVATNLDERELGRRYNRDDRSRTFDRLRSQWHPHELAGESYRRLRRPWHVVLKLDERCRDPRLIERNAQARHEFLAGKAAPHENFVELMHARDAALELARIEAA